MKREPINDWADWYRAYDDPASSLSRRLTVVRQRIGETLDDLAGRNAARIVSLCAGDGRDLLPELATRPAVAADVVLVELDPVLAAAARRHVEDLTLSGVDVRTADAGRAASWADAVPVDLLLLCGIFGNVSQEDIAATVAAVPSVLAPRGFVIWTRGRFAGGLDLRPVIRRWFVDAGAEGIAFDGEPESFGVGVNRLVGPPATSPPPERLFEFIR